MYICVCVHVYTGVHIYFAIAALISGQLINKEQANSKKNADIFRIKCTSNCHVLYETPSLTHYISIWIPV